MLLFGSAQEIPMSTLTLFPDHAVERLLYYLPSTLELAYTKEGNPDFSLIRYRGTQTGGGLLRMRQRLTADETEIARLCDAGWDLRAISFESGRFKLRLRTWINDEQRILGEWHPAVLEAQEIIVPAVSLSPDEALTLRELLDDERNTIETELELIYYGMTRGTPWMVTTQTAQLKEQLWTLLQGKPATVEMIIAAFMSLPDTNVGGLRQTALEDGVEILPRDQLLTELALRSLNRLFTPINEGDSTLFHLLPLSSEEPETINWDLLPPRLEQRRQLTTWSISQLYHQINDPEARQKLFPSIRTIKPFENVDIFVFNQVPFDPCYLTKVTVDVRYTGETSALEARTFTFNGTENLANFSTFYPALTDGLNLEYRLSAQIAAPSGVGWPKTIRRDFVSADGLVIEISRQRLGIDFVRVEAEPELFLKSPSLEVQLYGTENSLLECVTLTSERLRTSVALPGIEPSAEIKVRVSAAPPNNSLSTFTVYEGPLIARQIKLAAYQLEVLEPDRIEVWLKREIETQYAFVGIQIAPLTTEGHYYHLEVGKRYYWNIYRISVFEPLRYRYRIDYITYNSAGQTTPLVSTDWLTGTEPILIVDPSH